MSNEISIFKDPNAINALANTRGVSDLGRAVASSGALRSIKTNNVGSFKRFVNGEQVGRAVPGKFPAIIVNMLPKVSRSYYEAAYDPDGTPTLPDCWSNDGITPEAGASNKQCSNCMSCPMNIKGSGDGDRRACRFQRRVAILLVGDKSGDVYQFQIPSKSLFGKGNGNTHPFESYVKFLVANNTSPDYVVTEIAYDDQADTMQMHFTPLRPINEAEFELVKAAQEDPETLKYIQLVSAQADGVTAQPKPKAQPAPEPEPVEEPEPVAEVKPKQTRTRTARPKPNGAVAAEEENPFGDDAPAEDTGTVAAADDDASPFGSDEVVTPARRAAPAKPKAEPKPSRDFADVISAWAEDGAE